MRYALILSALAATTLAAPRPQGIEFDLVDAAPDVTVVAPPTTGTSDSVPVQPASAAAAVGTEAVDSTTTTRKRDAFLGKRDGDCAKQPAGTGPAVTSPADDAQSFLDYQAFKDTANTAPVPQGYTSAFTNLQASSQMSTYMGYKTLSSYDVFACQQYCDSKPGCAAFNIYYERDPSKDPNADACPNPASITNIKCAAWGSQVDETTATNDGQYRDMFHVVISGSNGYNKNAGPPPAGGYTGPVVLGGAINAPLDPTTKTNTYAGYKFFAFGAGNGDGTVTTYNNGVTACLNAAQMQTAYNQRHPPASPAKPAVVNQVNTYVLSKNNIAQGVYCSFYTEAWAADYATNYGQYRGKDQYTVSQSYAYTNAEYAAKYPDPVCDVGGCSPYYKGGNCGGYGKDTC